MKLNKIIFSLLASSAFWNVGFAQQQESLPAQADLKQLIDYALNNKISVKTALLDEEIGDKEIASALSAWYPQIAATGSYNHNLKIPTTVISGNTIQMGQKNSTALTLQVDQKILDPSLLQASKAAKVIRTQNKQNTENQRITTVVDVSKAYYDILTSEEQIKIVQENITRLQKQYNDALARYETGLVDKTDFKRAQIALSNARADEKRTVELRKYKYDYLKQLLGLQTQYPLNLSFANQNMEAQILVDTSLIVDINKRIEYRQLQTTKRLQEINTQYQKWTYLPTVGAFMNYGLDYRNSNFFDQYSDAFPRSVAGLSLNLPIFTGGKRRHDLAKSKLQEDRIDLQLVDLKNQINTQYSLASANYRANMNDWKTSKENVALSMEVYNTIKLQYDEGIKTYLDLMTAETDLRTSQLNYLNALYAVLSSKIDVDQALGTIQTEY